MEMPKLIEGYKPGEMWSISSCSCSQHNPPNLLFIQPGQSYTHTCPSCKKETVVHGGPLVLCDA